MEELTLLPQIQYIEADLPVMGVKKYTPNDYVVYESFECYHFQQGKDTHVVRKQLVTNITYFHED